MKMINEDYEFMLRAISSLDRMKLIEHKSYLEGDCHPKPKDIEKRFRWDCFYAAKLSGWCCERLYKYLNDEHIDTALKKVMMDTGI